MHYVAVAHFLKNVFMFISIASIAYIAVCIIYLRVCFIFMFISSHSFFR